MRSLERIELIDVVNTTTRLGESILWNASDKRVWWTDIPEKRLFRYRPANGAVETFALPEKLGSFGFVANSNHIVAAFESGFALYEPERGALEWIARLPRDTPHIRMNDGRVDRQGRFWASTMHEDWNNPVGKLYRLDKNGRCTVVEENIAIPNSLCFSLDGTKMYFADSPSRIIHRYDLDPASGAVSAKHVFAVTPEGAYPDGAQIDSAGHLWVACWGGSRVIRYTPDGEIDCTIDLPVSGPTCVAFGGEDLTTLFVTTTRDGLSEDELRRQPLAGSVFVFKVPVPGILDAGFDWKPT